MRTSCPDCGSKRFVKNGVNKHFEQNHLCKDCGRQFVLDPEPIPKIDLAKKR
jgi:transposase-like protein